MSDSAAPPSIPFASDGSFFEQFQRMQEAQKASNSKAQLVAQPTSRESSPQAPPPVAIQIHSHAEASSSLENQDFLPATYFAGSRPGYLFKNDELGLGYYRDGGLDVWAQKKQEQAKAKPSVIKANKGFLKGVKSSSLEPAAKKAKTDATDGKPKYLREMEKYKSLSCSGDTKHDRPLVK